MKRGRGKQKGAAYERDVCKKLSLWITKGHRLDCFWRSAMSGGRATIAHGRDVRQCGDITAVSTEGYSFASAWFVECKHVKHLALDSFLVKGVGPLRKFWDTALRESRRHGRAPMIIARQNGWPDIVISKHNHVAHWAEPLLTLHSYGLQGKYSIDITLFSELLKVSYDGLDHGRPTIKHRRKR